MKTTSVIKTAPLVLAVCLGLASTRAQDAKPTEPPPPKWDSVASIDLALTRGNSRTFLGTLTFNTTKKWPTEEVLFGANAGYGNSTAKNSSGAETTTETQDYLKGYGQYNHLFTDRIYAGVRLEGLHDNVAGITYRLTLSPMAGYYFIKQTNTFLAGEVGPALITEKLGHHSKTYAGLRVAERFEHKFDGGAKIWETLEWIPQVDQFNNWILNAEVGVSAPVMKSLDVRLVAQDSYNNRPAAGRLKNDLKFLAGVGYRF